MRKIIDNPLLPVYFIAVFVFYFTYGFDVLLPTNINWLMSIRLDLGGHYLGWAYFRYEPWTFPLGAIKNYAYPIGTNIGFTDSIPLLALLFKPFSAILPYDFQYIGLWMLFCYVLIAHYTFKIVNLYAVKLPYALAVVAIVVANPALWFRGVHPALCLHGFILAGIYLYLKPGTKQNSGATNWHQVILLAISALIHPYITVIIVGFNFIIPIKHYVYDKSITLAKAVLYPLVALTATVSLWCIVGLIDFKGGQSYAAATAFETPFNLNSLYNSWGLSSFFRGLSRGGERNFESFMYLGLGMFIIIVLALISFIVWPKRIKKIANYKSLLPLAVLITLMSVFALSNKAMMGNTVIYTISLPDALLYVGKVFRASARFFWPAYYCIMLFFSLVVIKSKVLGKATLVVLLLLVGLQAYDLKKLFGNRHPVAGSYNTPLDDDSWINITRNYDRIIIYKPFVIHNVKNGDWQDLLYLALKNHKPISTGNTARDNTKGILAYTDSLTYAIENNLLLKNELYVTTPQYLDNFIVQLCNKQLIANYLDGFYLLHAPGKKFNITKPARLAVIKTDSVAKRYSHKSIFTEYKAVADNKIHVNMESFFVTNNVIRAGGWAFIKDASNTVGDSVFITLKKGNTTYRSPATIVAKPGISEYFKKENIENCGFNAILYSDFAKGDSIGLAIKTKKGAWAYTPFIKATAQDDFIKPVVLNKLPGHDMQQEGGVDDVEADRANINVTGWSVLKTSDSANQLIQVVLTSNKKTYTFNALRVLRTDITDYLKGRNYDTAGYKARIAPGSLQAGTYKVGVLVKEKGTGRQSVTISDKTVTIN